MAGKSQLAPNPGRTMIGFSGSGVGSGVGLGVGVGVEVGEVKGYEGPVSTFSSCREFQKSKVFVGSGDPNHKLTGLG